MTKTMRRFVRVLVRFQNRVEAIHDAAAEAYDRDAEFDGGEFSGPAIARQVARDVNRAARRLGFASEDVALEAARIVGAAVPYPAFRMMGDPVPIPGDLVEVR